MSEHTYRLLLGSFILLVLYTEMEQLAYVLVALTLFEGLTNQRLNLVINRIRHISNDSVRPQKNRARFNFDAEQAQRLFVAISFGSLFFFAPKEVWILNWYFAFGMLISGIVLFCPVIAFFRAIGFR